MWLADMYPSRTLYLEPGAKRDILYLMKEWIDIVIVDISRSNKEKKHLYGTLESIKNGRFISTKYESQDIRLNKKPHVIVFANKRPKEGKMTEDKLAVYVMNNKYVLE